MKAITETLEVSRSHQYEKAKKPCQHYRKAGDDGCLSLLRQITDDRSTYGCRRVAAILNRILEKQGEPRVNHKRVYRIMKVNNLLLQHHTGRPVRLHDSMVMRPRSNERWCSDVFEIPCWNGKRIRVAFSMDCCDREVMSYVANTEDINGDMVRGLMAESIESRIGPVDQVPKAIKWLSDNGLAYTALETRNFAGMMGRRSRTTSYYSPESNGMAESFIKTFKRDHVHMSLLYDARSVMEQSPKWFEDYNEYPPHKGLKILSISPVI